MLTLEIEEKDVVLTKRDLQSQKTLRKTLSKYHNPEKLQQIVWQVWKNDTKQRFSKIRSGFIEAFSAEPHLIPHAVKGFYLEMDRSQPPIQPDEYRILAAHESISGVVECRKQEKQSSIFWLTMKTLREYHKQQKSD